MHGHMMFLNTLPANVQLRAFLRESLRIEGINRAPTKAEIAATRGFLLGKLTFREVVDLQMVYTPAQPLRTKEGMNVRVGDYTAPPGCDRMVMWLTRILDDPNMTPWRRHTAFETLHPFMDGNGRTGRAVWLHDMLTSGKDPFDLPFLHRFYYQTLAELPSRLTSYG